MTRREPPGRRPHWANPKRRALAASPPRCGRCGGLRTGHTARCPSQFDALRTADDITAARLALLEWWDVQRAVYMPRARAAFDDFAAALSGRAAELGIERWEAGDRTG